MSVSRREFLKYGGLTVAAGVMAACDRNPVVATARAIMTPTRQGGEGEIGPIEPTPAPEATRMATQETQPIPPLPYEAPNLAEARIWGAEDEVPEGLILSESVSRQDLINTLASGGFQERDLAVYENAVRTWVDSIEGWSSDQVTFEYVVNGASGDNFRWAMFPRDTSGNILWTQQGDSLGTYPLVISPHTPDQENPSNFYVNPILGLRRLDNTANARVIIKNGYPIVLGGEVLDIEGERYFTQWLNTQSNGGEFVDIPDVAVERNLLNGIEFFIQGDDAVQNESTIRRGARGLMRYMRSLGMYEQVAVRVFVYQDRDQLMDDAQDDTHGWNLGLRAIADDNGLAHSYHDLYVWSGQRGGPARNEKYWFETGASIIEPILTQLTGPERPQELRVGSDHAGWLFEGAFWYFKYKAREQAGLDPLEFMHNAIRWVHEHPPFNLSEDLQQRPWYAESGFLAVKYLCENTPSGDRSILDHYRAIAATPWRTAFETNFAHMDGTPRALRTFYNEEWRPYAETNYPHLYQRVHAALLDENNAPINGAWVWVWTREAFEQGDRASLLQSGPVISGIFWEGNGWSWVDVPKDTDLVMAFSATSDPDSIFGYYQQTETRPSRVVVAHGDDDSTTFNFDASGIFTPNLASATSFQMRNSQRVNWRVTGRPEQFVPVVANSTP